MAPLLRVGRVAVEKPRSGESRSLAHFAIKCNMTCAGTNSSDRSIRSEGSFDSRRSLCKAPARFVSVSTGAIAATRMRGTGPF